jgi:hypothetical protein
MKVNVLSDADELLWSRQTMNGDCSGITSADYLQDGTQQRIIGALVEALSEARGELGGFRALQVVDAIAHSRAATAEIESCIPKAGARDSDSRR